MSTAPLARVFRLCSCIARLLYFESISYGFCDAYCRGHTRSRPERAVGSLLASLSGKCLEQARDCNLSCLTSIPNTLNHLSLLPGSLGNRWKKAFGSWLGLLPQHVTDLQEALMLKRQMTGCSPQDAVYPSKRHKDTHPEMLDDYLLPRFSFFQPGLSHSQHYESLESSLVHSHYELQSIHHHGDRTYQRCIHRPPPSLLPTPCPPPSFFPSPLPPPSLYPSPLPPPSLFPSPLPLPLPPQRVHDTWSNEAQFGQHRRSRHRVRYHQPPQLSRRVRDPWIHQEHRHYSQNGCGNTASSGAEMSTVGGGGTSLTQDTSCTPHPHPPRLRAPIRPIITVNKPLETVHPSPVLSVVSYNVLAQDLINKNPYLYTHCPRELLDWEYRKSNILNELVESTADILCLQEVEEEHFGAWFSPQLHQHGYAGIYQKRTGSHKDGCAVFYRTAGLELLTWRGVKYQKGVKVLDRDNVGIVAKFAISQGRRSDENTAVFCLATTHLLFNPKAGDVKLAQLSCLIAELHHIASTTPGNSKELYPCIICGDLNCVPNCPLLEFVECSTLKYACISGLEIAGYFKNQGTARRIPVPLLPAHLNITPSCTYRDSDLIGKSAVVGGTGTLTKPPVSKQEPQASSVRKDNANASDHESTACVDNACGGIDFPSLNTNKQENTNCKETTVGASSMETGSTPYSDVELSALKPSMDISPLPAKSSGPISPVQDACDIQIQPATPLGTITHPFKLMSAYPHSTNLPSTVTTYHKHAFETVDYVYFTPLSIPHSSHETSSKRKGFHLLGRKVLPSTHTMLNLGPQPHRVLSSDHLLLQANFQLFSDA